MSNKPEDEREPRDEEEDEEVLAAAEAADADLNAIQDKYAGLVGRFEALAQRASAADPNDPVKQGVDRVLQMLRIRRKQIKDMIN